MFFIFIFVIWLFDFFLHFWLQNWWERFILIWAWIYNAFEFILLLIVYFLGLFCKFGLSYRYFRYLWTENIYISRFWSHLRLFWSRLALIFNHHHLIVAFTLTTTYTNCSLCLDNLLCDCSYLKIYFCIQSIELIKFLLEMLFLWILLYSISTFQLFLNCFVLLSIVVVYWLFLTWKRFGEWDCF